ncbi:MAG TPA: SMP-30/gluconolactonase/LRE family protein [Candidatus Limnocylindrales bacterium]|nr:SMP-30/gluconolactonase/LRE family protein [Candidatus Limnocylindrales bacterium]
MKTLLTGLGFGESPRWHGGRLWFCNWGTGEIISVPPSLGGEVGSRVETVVPVKIPYCIDWLPDGRLLVVLGPEGVLARLEPDGSLATHAELGPGMFNEIVLDGAGNIYVNGGGFDGPGNILVVTPDGAVREVATGIEFGNGMVVTPDGSTLIVAESWGNRLSAFDIGTGGGLSNRRVWAELGDAAPDGICLDASGAVWYADVPHRCCVRVREGGEVLERVELDRGGFACALGGQTLYVLAAEFHGFETVEADLAARTGILAAVEVSVPAAATGGS